MRKLGEDSTASTVPEYSYHHEYRTERIGPTTNFYMHMTPEIKKMVGELRLRSSEGGLISLHIPNGDLPPAVTIHCDDKARKLKEMLKAADYKEKNNSHMPLENRIPRGIK